MITDKYISIEDYLNSGNEKCPYQPLTLDNNLAQPSAPTDTHLITQVPTKVTTQSTVRCNDCQYKYAFSHNKCQKEIETEIYCALNSIYKKKKAPSRPKLYRPSKQLQHMQIHQKGKIHHGKQGNTAPNHPFQMHTKRSSILYYMQIVQSTLRRIHQMEPKRQNDKKDTSQTSSQTHSHQHPSECSLPLWGKHYFLSETAMR